MSADYVPERGYTLGPTLEVGEQPWPLFWEQDPAIDECMHQWERVVVQSRHVKPEPVVRCTRCRAPRCGHSDDRDPCMERRHHRTMHIHLSGLFDPVGGQLRPEENR